MELLYFLEKIRIPVLNELMLMITMLGEETAFLIIALVVFWCVDKRRGYFLMAVGFMGTILNQILKLLCRVPRPWVLDRNFTILEQAREAAAGYSFPSGHTTMAVGTFGALAVTEKRRWLKWSFILVAVLVGFSRMYVGVHTPWDVLAGALTSLVLIFLLEPIIYSGSEKKMAALLAAMLALAAVFLLFVELYPFPADTDAHNLESGLKNAYTMIGCLSGVVLVYYGEKKWVKFTTGGVWWVQIIKAALGLGLVLAVKSGLKAPLEALFDGHLAARSVRYFLIVVTAGLLWPMTFRFWQRLGNKENHK